MIEWYKMAFTKYAEFSGRSTRNEYWWFVLCNILVTIALYSIVIFAAIIDFAPLAFIAGLMIFVYMFAAIIPSVAVLVRRLHDVGKSGWFYFITLIPLVGGIVLLVFLAKESEPRANEWGPIPGHSYANTLGDSFVDYDKDIV